MKETEMNKMIKKKKLFKRDREREKERRKSKNEEKCLRFPVWIIL